jgi:hypothetical protein
MAEPSIEQFRIDPNKKYTKHQLDSIAAAAREAEAAAGGPSVAVATASDIKFAGYANNVAPEARE